MVKKVSSAHKLGPLQRNMDKKVSKLVLQLLDERTQEMKAKGQTIGPFSVALVRNLSELEIVRYAQSQDRSFGRVKEENIRKSVQRTLKPLLQEEEEEIKNLGINPDTLLHSEEVDDNNEPLMEVRDLNKANKSIVEMWKEGAKEESEKLKSDKDAMSIVETIKLGQKRVDNTAAGLTECGISPRNECIQLIKEDDAWNRRSCSQKDFPDGPLGLTHELIQQLGTLDRDEVGLRLVCNRFG